MKRKKWLEALGLQNVDKKARICSNHFPEDAFDKRATTCIKLRGNAVPNFCVDKSNKNKAKNSGTETNTLSQDDSQDLSESKSVEVEGITIHTISDDEMSLSEKEKDESPAEITHGLINPVADISNKCKSNVFFYFGDGDVPGFAPLPKAKPEKTASAQPYQYSSFKSQSINCSPRRKPIENEPEIPPCITCGMKKKRSLDRATSVSPERILHCPIKKQIREHYENEIKVYKQQMRGLQQKVRRLEASKNKFNFDNSK
ncbi:uncharacterized protein LOC117181804 isoform X2 [Belonocnema kinseyi]|nr:uncharacterized protein LOC117181804 isoform X2 [Belonocnema kinseyi]